MKWSVGPAEQLKDFARYYGHEELSFTLSKANDILLEIKRRASIISKTYDRLKNVVHEFLVDVLPKTKSQTFYGLFILINALLLLVIVIKT